MQYLKLLMRIPSESIFPYFPSLTHLIQGLLLYMLYHVHYNPLVSEYIVYVGVYNNASLPFNSLSLHCCFQLSYCVCGAGGVIQSPGLDGIAQCTQLRPEPKCCFCVVGINSVCFDEESKHITAMKSLEGEVVPFKNKVLLSNNVEVSSPSS